MRMSGEDGETRAGETAQRLVGRAFLPTRNVLEELGDMMLLTGRTIRSALFPPYPYGG
jgi:hypothetical protein